MSYQCPDDFSVVIVWEEPFADGNKEPESVLLIEEQQANCSNAIKSLKF